MGLFDKIGRGLSKLGSFTGKVLKGIASGGVVGGVAAAATNLGGGSSAQKATFTSSSTTLGNTNPTTGQGGAATTFDWGQALKWVGIVGGGGLLLWLVVKMFSRKR